MKRQEKEGLVATLTDRFRSSDAVFLTEYRGLSVPQIAELREKLGHENSYHVAKNTLARIASKEAGMHGLDDLLKGPVAITFVKGDYAKAAKTLRDFAVENKQLVPKGGYAEGTVYDKKGFETIASLGSRDDVLSTLAAAMKGTLSKAARLFDALPTKAVRTVDALRTKQEKAA